MSNDKFSEAGKCKKMWSYCLQSDEWWASTSRMWQWKMIAASYANILPIFSVLFWYKSLRLKAWDWGKKTWVSRLFQVILKEWLLEHPEWKLLFLQKIGVYFFFFLKKKEVLVSMSHLKCISRKELVSQTSQCRGALEVTQHKWHLALFCLPSEQAVGKNALICNTHGFCLSFLSQGHSMTVTDCRANQGKFWGSSCLGEPLTEMEILPQIFSCAFSLQR